MTPNEIPDTTFWCVEDIRSLNISPSVYDLL